MSLMRKPFRAALGLGLLVILIAAGRQVGYSQSQDREIFPTGHAVEGAFLEYYRSVENPELVYGYPITEAFTDADGLFIQYFQRARFELGPDGVRQSPLGTLLYRSGRPESVFNNRPGTCLDFDNGFRVCADFKSFYEQHGGLAQFGKAISPVEADGMRQVQYFEYARLEWHPESAEPGLQIRIGDLGQFYFDFLEEDPLRLRPEPSHGIIEVTELRLHAFPATTSVRGAASQQVFIIVRDQNYAPLKEVEIAVTVRYPNGDEKTTPAVTNEFGFLEFEVALDPAAFGQGRVYVSAAAAQSGVDETTQTSFWSTP
jgi:hypothetical protein